MDAPLGGLAYVELAKVAVDKSTHDSVKQFGQTLIDDHTKANDELKQVASQQNVQIPDSLDSKHQSKIDKLSKLSGPAFDRAFVKAAIKDHQKDVREFQQEAQNGTMPQVKDFASKTLPTLQSHLEMAKNLKNQKATASR
jgi:putative membrane protein